MGLTLALLVIVALVVAALYVLNRKMGATPKEVPRRRRLMATSAQSMYARLREAYPEHVVLARVSFSSLLTASHRRTRDTFNRRVADFVLCNKAFEVLAVIEMDDPSRQDSGEANARSELLLTDAGYTVLRFKTVPDVAALKAEVAAHAK
ncbi:DUF2726 domain-containing protein [Sphaerotilaceae bacterium SBD11-9]